jgi:hypothetical protein
LNTADAMSSPMIAMAPKNTVGLKSATFFAALPDAFNNVENPELNKTVT